MWKWLWAAACLLTGAASVSAVEPTPCPLLKEAPVIDGRLDDHHWKGVPYTGGLVSLTDARTPEPAAQQTRFKIARTSDTLVLAVECAEPAMAQLAAVETARDGKSWQDDCVEFMVDPTGRGGGHFQFVVNAHAALFDAFRDQGGKVPDVVWNSRTQAAVAREAARWTLEMAIPLSDLRLTSDSLAGDWKFNIARRRCAGGEPAYFTFVRSKALHVTAEHAPLKVAAEGLRDFLWPDLALLRHQVAMDGARILLEGAMLVANGTGARRSLVLEPSVWRGGELLTSQPMSLDLDDQVTRQVRFKMPLTLQQASGMAVIELVVRDRETSRMLARRPCPADITFSALGIEMTPRLYRNNIYATQNLIALRGKARASFTPETLAGLRLRVAFQGADREIAAQVFEPPQAENDFTLNIGKLEPGRYELTAEVAGAGDALRTTLRQPIRVLPPYPKEVRLDENNVTLINGRPFLPHGWFSVAHHQFPQAAAEGCNVVISYDASYYFTPEYRRRYLDDAHKAGIHMVLKPYPDRKMVDDEAMRQPLSEADGQAVREFVRACKDHPALLGWYMGDEIEACPALPQRMLDLYRIIADEDPFHPCILLNNTVEGMVRYAHTCDILMPDPYPLFDNTGFAARGLSYSATFLKEIPRLDRGRLGSWLTPEGFNYGDYGQPGGRAPELHELRAQCLLSIIHGSTGMVWYTYGNSLAYPQTSAGVPYVHREYEALRRFALAPQSRRTVALAAGGPDIVASHHVLDGAHLVVAVNMGRQKRPLALTLPAGAPASWHVFAEDRALEAAGGTLRDEIEPFHGRVYTSDASLARAVSLADGRAAVEAARQRRLVTRNLALQENGVTVAVSSKRSPTMFLNGVNDGIRKSEPLDYAYFQDGCGRGYEWMSQQPAKFPEWATITFPKPSKVARVAVYDEFTSRADVQILDGGQWTTVAELTRTSPIVLEASFAPRECSAVRIQFHAVRGLDYVRIEEIEIYAP